jgi:hypothetical protein
MKKISIMFVAVHLLLLFVSDFAFFYFIFLLKKTESLTRLKEEEKKKPDRLGRPVFYRFCAGSHVFFRFAGTTVLRTDRTGNRSGSRFNRFDRPVRSGFDNLGNMHTTILLLF